MSDLTALESALSEVTALLGDAEARLLALSAEADDLRLEKAGLERAVARRRSQVPPTRPEASGSPSEVPGPVIERPTSDGWRRLSRTDAVLKMLAEIGDEASPTELERRIRELGRDDTRRALGAALSYLQTQGKVYSVGRGRWKFGPKPQEPGYPANALAAQERSMNGDQAVLHREAEPLNDERLAGRAYGVERAEGEVNR